MSKATGRANPHNDAAKSERIKRAIVTSIKQTKSLFV